VAACSAPETAVVVRWRRAGCGISPTPGPRPSSRATGTEDEILDSFRAVRDAIRDYAEALVAERVR
jgi:hypothetical protein